MRRLAIAIVASALLCLSGCGGGGSNASPTDGVVTQTLNGYGITATYQAKAGVKPLVASGNANGAAFTGLYGVNFTAVQTNQVPTLANTKIAYVRNSNLWVASPDLSNAQLVTRSDLADASGAPAFQPSGRLIANNQITPGSAINIYFTTVDGVSNTKMTAMPNDAMFPAWNPSGTKCAFASAGQIYSITSSGGTPVNLSSNGFSDSFPIYSRDGSKIYFWRFDGATATFTTYSMNPDGTNQQASNLSAVGASTIAGQCFSPDGSIYLYSDGSTLFRKSPFLSGSWLTPPSGHSYKFPSFSPDASKVIFEDDTVSTKNLDMCDFDGANITPVTLSSTSSDPAFSAPTWGPFPQNRNVVGPGGNVATNASGFIVGQDGPTLVSFVAFACTTPSTSVIVAQAQTSTNCVFQLKGDAITKLAFVNDLQTTATAVVPVSGLTSVGGALVSFDSTNGRVVSVIPFSPGAPKMATAKNGKLLSYTGHFLGIWNGSGKNLAPNGAAEVRIDAETGKLVSYR